MPAAELSRASARQTSASGRGGAAPGQSSRMSGRSGGVGGKKKARGGPELMIAAGIIVVLGVTAAGLYVMRKNEHADVIRKLEEAVRVEKENFALAFDMFSKADAAGRLFVMGKEEADEGKLLASFRGDEKIYNVIYERSLKEKRGANKTEQKALHSDRLLFHTMSNPFKEDQDVKMNYGLADGKATPIVIAKKFIKSAEGDQANLGGTITVVVRAKTDRSFANAQTAKPVEEKKAP